MSAWARREARRPVVRAAGALVWREAPGARGGLEVALVHRPRYDDWSWPKGKLDPGESLPAAAIREVAEETGLPVVLGAPLPPVSYLLADGRRKAVSYWAARVAGPGDADRASLAARPVARPPDPDEVDDVRWVDLVRARLLLDRADDRAPLAAVAALHRRRALATRSFVVVRHGRAVRRADWPADDPSRPLTAAGRDQAAALAPLLAAFGVARVATSPWLRCRETVDPYAGAADLAPLELEPLSEGVGGDPATARAATEALLTQPESTAVCTHRPVLGAVLGVLARASQPHRPGLLPAGNPYLRTAEALVAHVAGAGGRPRVVAVERHPPGVR